MENETKLCKHCKSEIPKGAKVCPNCRKKQGGIGKWIAIVVVVLVLIAAVSGGSDNKDKNPQKVGEATTGTASAKEETKENDASDADKTTDAEDTSDAKQETEEVNNVFQVGDVVETENFKITFVSAGAYESGNQFLQPKDGYEYWQFEFKFENISDTDQAVSSMIDWECYADNSKADQTWIGDDSGLDATLSAGRETQGTIYFEVPKDVQSVELEYDINFWQSDKIVFVGK